MDRDRLLVTADDLRVYDYARRVEDVHKAKASAERFLGAAQEGLQTFLGYDPLVHRVPRRALRWRYPTGTVNGRIAASDGVPWEAHGAGTGPIVEASAAAYVPTGTAADYYTLSVSDDGHLLEVDAADPLPPFVDLYEGWRGAHHVIPAEGEEPGEKEVDLRTLPGLSGLTALPPVLRDDLFTAICEAAIYLALRPALLGVDTVEVDLGSQVKRRERVLPLVPEMRDLYALHAGRSRRVNA